MTIRTLSTLFAALLTASIAFTAAAADTVPSVAGGASAAKTAASDVPAIGQRVGGSPADAEFREAIQKSGADFRAARAACRQKAGDERSECIKRARAKMKAVRAEAKAKHDQALRDAKSAPKS